MELATAMTTGACFWSSVLSISSSSPTPCSSRRTGSKQNRGTHAPNTGTSWNTPKLSSDTRDILHTRVMPSADCYTDHRLVRCKVAFAFKSPPKKKGPQTKKLQVHKLRDPRVRNNLQVMFEERLHCVTAAELEEQWKQMKTMLQETTAEVVGLSTRKHQDWFDKADKKVQESCLKRNAPATIICLQNLMIKLPRLHTKLPAVHSRQSLGPCRMIGGQDLPRGHNGMLTWVTCTPTKY